MASTGVSIGNYVRLVRGNANFRRLWLAQIVSENGDWFYTLAIYSLLLDLTGKASSVAMALVLQVLPHTSTGTAGGHRERSLQPPQGHDRHRPAAHGDRGLHAAGAQPRICLGDLSAAVSGNRDGGVL